jgi:hypothetical protein
MRPEPQPPPPAAPAHVRGDVILPAPPPPLPAPTDAPATGRTPQGETSVAPTSSVSPDTFELLPKVTAILTSEERRIALVDGRIVRIGDTVGRWRVSAIEARAVVFMDVSGAELRVPLR